MIRGRSGEELCKVWAPHGWQRPRILSGSPWDELWVSSIHSQSAWKNPEAVVRWAWLQAALIRRDVGQWGVDKSLKQLRESCYTCCVCLRDSVIPKFGLLRRGWVRGFECSNRDCVVAGVLLPAVLVARLGEAPDGTWPVFFTDRDGVVRSLGIIGKMLVVGKLPHKTT